MSRFRGAEAAGSLELLRALRLVNPCEATLVQAFLSEAFLGECFDRAETIHLHVKIADTGKLPSALLEAAGAELDHARAGFVKFRLPGAVNAIFSHIPVSADDLVAGEVHRSRPFLDHVGIDVRAVDVESRAAFDALPSLARARGWAHVAQGGPGHAVRCCHVEVAEKRWLYPAGAATRPIEVAFGPLRANESGYGCDLRPSHPALARGGANACCPR